MSSDEVVVLGSSNVNVAPPINGGATKKATAVALGFIPNVFRPQKMGALPVNMVTGKKTTAVALGFIPNVNEKSIKYKIWGKSRSNRLIDYDYSSDRPVHVVICANNKKKVFNSKNNAEIAVGELLKAAQDIRFIILCYCLMPDHLHAVVSPGNSGVSLSRFLNIFKGRTSASFRKYGITNLWQRSAFDHVIRRDEDLKVIIEYILNNPVRKGIAEKADCYPYSRYFEDKINEYI